MFKLAQFLAQVSALILPRMDPALHAISLKAYTSDIIYLFGGLILD
jgi:hypothetical protein